MLLSNSEVPLPEVSRVVADGFHQLSQRGLIVGQSWPGIVERRGEEIRQREGQQNLLAILTTNAVGKKDLWIDP